MNKKLLFQTEYQKTELSSKVVPFFTNFLKPGNILLFCGHVGAGKTHLIKTLLAKCFSVKNITSPTYAYVKKYTTIIPQNNTNPSKDCPNMQKHEVCTQMPIKSDKAHKNLVNIAHFDLYRLNTAEDFFALGFWQDLFEPQQITFIEWPEILFSLLEEITQTNKVFLVNLSANKEHFEKSRHLQFFEFINKSL